jgi:hypothetical protein
MERASAFLDRLRARVAPECDAEVVQAVFRRAAARYPATGRDRNGRRVSVITPSGVPFEASVSGGAGGPQSALRYLTEAATGVPFFGQRLAAQLGVLDDLVRWLPPEADPAAAGADLRDFVGTLFPDPGVVPARTRVATWFGIVHRPERPAHLDRLKVYGNLAADERALGRLAATREPMGRLAAAVEGLPGLSRHLAAVEVDRTGGVTHKLYFFTDRTDAAFLCELAGRFGADASGLAGEIDGWRSGEAAGPRRGSFCCHATPDGRLGVSVYRSAKSLGLGQTQMADLVHKLAERYHGTTTAVDALVDAAADTVGTGSFSFVGIGLSPDGPAKLNAYYVPAC